MIERKCLQCGTWNKDEDECLNCGNALSPKAIEAEKEAIRKAQDPEKPSLLDVYLEKAKKSKYWAVRVGYRILYSIAVFVGLLGALVAWMAALANA